MKYQYLNKLNNLDYKDLASQPYDKISFILLNLFENITYKI